MRRHRIDGYTLAVTDLLTALVICFAAMAVLSIIAVKKQADSVNQGVLIFEMTWPLTINADIDLWIRAPGDTAVGFASRDSVDCDLLRDDRGRAYDINSRNEEIAVCRAVPDGEWIVDNVCYVSSDGQFPIPVTTVVKQQKDGSVSTLLTRTVQLDHCQEQVTVWRFSTLAHSFVPGSVNHLPLALYEAVPVEGGE